MGFLDLKKSDGSGGKQYSLVSQSTCPKIEIKRFDGKKLVPKILICSSLAGSKRSLGINTLQSYSFSRGIDDTEGSFTIRLKDRLVDGANVFDSIENFDVVLITENSNRGPQAEPDFVGVVHSVKVSSSIGSDGKVRKEISINGKSALSLFSDCFMNLGVVGTSLFNKAAADNKIKDTFAEVGKGEDGKTVYKAQSVRKIAETIWSSFSGYLSGYAQNVSNTSLFGIIGALGMDNFSSVENLPYIMPISTDLYNTESVCFMDMLRKIIPQGAYQIFAKNDTSLVVRECPYSAGDWKSLGSGKEVNLGFLTGYDFEKTDKEVYTVFMSLVEGSAIDSNYVSKLKADEDGLINVAANPEKIKKYGYRPLTVSYIGYVQNKAAQVGLDKSVFENNNRKMKEWYENIDEMLSGRIKIVNAYEKAGDVPRTGEKIVFNLFLPEPQQTEFLINSETHSWAYGSSPMIDYTVSRGAIYSPDGSFLKAAERFSTALETALGSNMQKQGGFL